MHCCNGAIEVLFALIFEIYLFALEDYGHPCHSYVELNQPERRISNRIAQQGVQMICDRNLRRRWYRFTGSAGGVMPEACVEEFSCGTHSPIWLNGRNLRQLSHLEHMVAFIDTFI